MKTITYKTEIFQSTTFHVVYKNVPAALTLHWTDGFLLKPFASPTYVFNYNFSQLKGSSDDGNATLKLVFEDARGSKEVVEEVILSSSTIHNSDTFNSATHPLI